MGLGPGTPPYYQVIRSPPSLCENIFLCFRLNTCSFVLFEHVYHMAPCQPLLHSFMGVVEWRGRNRVLHPTHRRGPCRSSPCVRCGRWPASHRKPMSTLETHLALSLLAVSKALFHCKSVWVMAFSGDLEPWSGVDFWDCCFWWNGSPYQEDNNCHSLDKVVNTEEPVWRTLPCQR